MSVVIANARQTVAAPVRKPRKYGLLSVVDVVDGGDAYWIMGGLTADGEECSVPLFGDIVCGPSEPKVSRSWFSDIDADPWLTYMYETCKTVGRYSDSAARLRARFMAAEQSAIEKGFQQNALNSVPNLGNFTTVVQAIGALEADAGAEYGGQIILHLPFVAAEEASSKGALVRVGDHLETVAGNLVSIGNYSANTDEPVVFATGAVTLYRGPITEVGPVLGSTQPSGQAFQMTNDYYSLIERPYAALIDCYMNSARGTVCGCGASDGGGPT